MQKLVIRQLHGPLPSIDAIRRAQQASRRVILNVGGIRHECLWSTLERLPKTRLGRLNKCSSSEELMQLCDDFDMDKGEYFFDRHPASFAVVLNFYRTAKLHLLDEICVMSFSEDLDYWNIDEVYLEPCCQHKYHQRKENVLEEIRRDEETIRLSGQTEDFGNGYCAPWRKRVWYALEQPQTSFAKVSCFTPLPNSDLLVSFKFYFASHSPGFPTERRIEIAEIPFNL